ncbi:hypothetical protein RclHR1_08360004 [Rhizophagus clarus]|uniref:Uncharacterized protein n=1 Tax=Rhizophagus clarus TaxID=94130 RepID=A0A2Z6S067_9GLOM|nr:hypothetical protein RclHR1_08360004 [Rhizophagus clarus]GET01467.1 hypothetical protein GLOIN_2v1779527 [Rhizophagus clarus]
MSNNYGQKTSPYNQKISLDNNAKICTDCKETSDFVKLFSNKLDKLEEVIRDFYKNPAKENKNNQLSIFNAKFTLNNVPCELEYNLSEFSLENLHILAISTTQSSDNKHPSSISSNETIDNESDDK